MSSFYPGVYRYVLGYDGMFIAQRILFIYGILAVGIFAHYKLWKKEEIENEWVNLIIFVGCFAMIAWAIWILIDGYAYQACTLNDANRFATVRCVRREKRGW